MKIKCLLRVSTGSGTNQNSEFWLFLQVKGKELLKNWFTAGFCYNYCINPPHFHILKNDFWVLLLKQVKN